MGTYVYGIVISVVMIAAGLSGQFSGGGSGINLPLVAFGVFFLIIDVTMLLRARQAGQQAPQADEAQPTGTEDAHVEANVEAAPSEQEQEATREFDTVLELDATTEASAEKPDEASCAPATETTPEA